MHFLKKHHLSFKNAFAGLFWALKTQQNFRIHVLLACVALVLSIILKISRGEFAVVIMTIAFGLGTEMVNTSIEEMTDLITIEWRKEAKIAKDVAAGMMLTTAFGAIGVSLIIFLPRLLVLFGF
ncbi:hypothetical protein A3D77_02225 [Candidatus Gottesmanbacteria bacterium RIFCSPHIGHO2_02_FULL_39_11]|uniref:Diacylglycerol kinase n=1 Tax=Candidatus Gottesmanbacteria bacterium RIFCSPHIGHO2_02_FULL_39_11 TaxID=1798382 RepID=A0A1F5ZV81_9BACT|nr:MAG: hypothetical protein A3D77_02225 [Candidatus Gottesmanbacteria bacterium RIFCSPHIGHO2_02_FULL_39_11]